MQARERRSPWHGSEDGQQLRQLGLHRRGEGAEHVVEPSHVRLQSRAALGVIRRQAAIEHTTRRSKKDLAARSGQPPLFEAGVEERDAPAHHREQGRGANTQFEKVTSLHAGLT